MVMFLVLVTLLAVIGFMGTTITTSSATDLEISKHDGKTSFKSTLQETTDIAAVESSRTRRAANPGCAIPKVRMM
jgi:Na+-transporting methylmalonyl-CoA/oxaloacetate decarboxylase gamma subunit